jgi:hypothetical protein
MCQLCRWGRVDICITFHKRAFVFFYTIAHLFDKFQNCATMNCQRNVNCILPTQLPHKFSYIIAILIHNHFELPNITNIFIAKLYQIVKKSKNVLNFKLPES